MIFNKNMLFKSIVNLDENKKLLCIISNISKIFNINKKSLLIFLIYKAFVLLLFLYTIVVVIFIFVFVIILFLFLFSYFYFTFLFCTFFVFLF